MLLEMYRLQELPSSENLSVCQRLLPVLVWTRILSGCTTNASDGDFISVVLIRMLPGAQSRLFCHDFTRSFWGFLFVFCFVVSTATGSSAKLDSLLNN